MVDVSLSLRVFLARATPACDTLKPPSFKAAAVPRNPYHSLSNFRIYARDVNLASSQYYLTHDGDLLRFLERITGEKRNLPLDESECGSRGDVDESIDIFIF